MYQKLFVFSPARVTPVLYEIGKDNVYDFKEGEGGIIIIIYRDETTEWTEQYVGFQYVLQSYRFTYKQKK